MQNMINELKRRKKYILSGIKCILPITINLHYPAKIFFFPRGFLLIVREIATTYL